VLEGVAGFGGWWPHLWCEGSADKSVGPQLLNLLAAGSSSLFRLDDVLNDAGAADADSSPRLVLLLADQF
jgi:hypothetical protein